MQEIAVKVVYYRQQKMKKFSSSKEDSSPNVGGQVEVIKNVIFLDVGATADVLTAGNNDVLIVETRTVHFV